VTTPSWTWILIFFGILPFLIARAFSRVRVDALVPMSRSALERARAFQWTVGGLLVLGGALLAAGIRAGPAVAWVGLALVLVGLLVLTVGWPFIWPTGHVEGEWVWLSFVHPRFAHELGRLYGPRAPSG